MRRRSKTEYIYLSFATCSGEKNTVLYFDYDEIYIKLGEFGLNYEEIKKLCIDMLYETHKRKVLTASFQSFLIYNRN